MMISSLQQALGKLMFQREQQGTAADCRRLLRQRVPEGETRAIHRAGS